MPPSAQPGLAAAVLLADHLGDLPARRGHDPQIEDGQHFKRFEFAAGVNSPGGCLGRPWTGGGRTACDACPGTPCCSASFSSLVGGGCRRPGLSAEQWTARAVVTGPALAGFPVPNQDQLSARSAPGSREVPLTSVAPGGSSRTACLPRGSESPVLDPGQSSARPAPDRGEGPNAATAVGASPRRWCLPGRVSGSESAGLAGTPG